MVVSPRCRRGSASFSSPACSVNNLLLIFVTFGTLTPAAHLGRATGVSDVWQADFFRHTKRGVPAKRGPPEDWDGKVPLVVTNKCDSTIWPGIATQSGTGPGTGGFELAPGKNRTLWVAPDWQGRVWGRTNCTVNGESCACKTGDCFAKLDCEFSVSIFYTLLGNTTHTRTGRNPGNPGGVQSCGWCKRIANILRYITRRWLQHSNWNQLHPGEKHDLYTAKPDKLRLYCHGRLVV